MLALHACGFEIVSLEHGLCAQEETLSQGNRQMELNGDISMSSSGL